MALLEVNKMSVNFGGIKPVSELDLHIEKGELVGLIGPNGAGKTTVFNLLTGVYTPTEGSILFDGERIDHLKTHQIVKKGITRTFQNIRLFKQMSVIDNVKVAFNNRLSYNSIECILRLPRYQKQEKWLYEEAMKLLEIFELDEYANELSMNLPYGKQRKLEIARALAGNPKLLLLDEPAAGMNPNETNELMHTIKMIRDQFNIAILLIEHDMHLVMSICERLVVIDYGNVIARGTPEEVQNNEKVIGAYLGHA
ncbi:MAG: ABC transporter ATP-binding protein [Niameybacter sp.]|uniref:ABC transporter ATP-binding protein n=1 Tax=Niameybacter sp. TaxID=2033640 RepID=UPI002FC8A376